MAMMPMDNDSAPVGLDPEPSSFDLIPDDEIAEIFGDSADLEDSDDDLNSMLLIAKSTQKARERALAAWNRYRGWVFRKYKTHLEPVKFWTDVVKEDEAAKGHCKKFLRLYVKASKRKRLVLGPEESVVEQGVKACRTVNTFWKALIAAADAEYLSKGWIYNEGAVLMNLTKESSYDKVEMTGRDTGRLLKTLFECADDIPVQHPIHRVIFHALVLLFTYGGFRRGMVMGPGSMRFRDVSMGLVRDPENPNRRRLVAEPTIKRNKLRRNALEHKKGTEFSFSATLLPTPIFCLTSLIAARGVQAGAFEGDFASCEELFNRPQFEEDVDWIPLDWKEEILDDKIFPMSPATFVRIFRRCLLVMGCRLQPRVYAFRVGAGADLDGCLTPALRNFVISQSTDVYEHNYMTKRVRVDLAHCRLGDLAGSNKLLFEYLRDLSIQRDPGAPIDLTEDQRQYMESRNDTTELREALAEAKKSNDKALIRKAKAALELHRNQVQDLLIDDARTKYFAEADRLRKLGLPTTHLRQPRPAGPREHSALDMKSVVQLWTEQAETWTRADELSLAAMDWLVL